MCEESRQKEGPVLGPLAIDPSTYFNRERRISYVDVY